jgi:hypothetical protein
MGKRPQIESSQRPNGDLRPVASGLEARQYTGRRAMAKPAQSPRFLQNPRMRLSLGVYVEGGKDVEFETVLASAVAPAAAATAFPPE